MARVEFRESVKKNLPHMVMAFKLYSLLPFENKCLTILFKIIFYIAFYTRIMANFMVMESIIMFFPDILLVSQVVWLTTLNMISLMKFYVMNMKTNRIVRLMNNIDEMMETQRGNIEWDDIFKDCNRKYLIFARPLCIIYAVSLVVVPLSPLADTYIFKREGGKRLLSYEAWFPFDEQKSPAYEIVYLHQVLDQILNLPMMLLNDVLFVFLCTSVIAQLYILQKKLKSATKVEDLPSCIRHHQFILRCVNEMEEIYQFHNFNQMGWSLVLFGTLLILMFVSAPAGVQYYELAITLAYMVAINLSMSHYSEAIAEESWRVVDAAYDAPWHEASLTFRRHIRYIMLRASKPAFLTAAGFVPLTLETFASVMKGAYSAYTILLQEHSK